MFGIHGANINNWQNLMKNSMLSRVIILCILYSFSVNGFSQIIPQPVSIVKEEGFFSFRPKMYLYTNLHGVEQSLLSEYLRDYPVPFVLTKDSVKSDVMLIKGNSSSTNPEAYRLHVNPHDAKAEASSSEGLFYALQTFAQLTRINGLKKVPCCEIIDEPRFVYRGFMLDVSRHFFSKDFIYKQLDMLALLKLNVFHLHLHDTGGWRLQLKSHPEMVRKTAYRKVQDWDSWVKAKYPFCDKNDSSAYGGYYTRKDIKDIIHYAKVRHITVVPEIDLPGHCCDVLYANPNLACENANWQNSMELCIGKEETFRFCEEVLSEIMELFPSKWIHIGGDECSLLRWEKCPYCRKRVQDENLDSISKLQGYFTSRIEKFLMKHGRRMIGWDEILDGRPSSDAVIMSWRPHHGQDLSQMGREHQLIMAPSQYTYFDSYQAPRETQPKAMWRDVPLDKVYSLNPCPDSLQSRILGLECCLWTEFISTQEHAEYMLYPRVLAFAELAWSPQDKRSYHDFLQRLKPITHLLKVDGYNYFDIDHSSSEKLLLP